MKQKTKDKIFNIVVYLALYFLLVCFLLFLAWLAVKLFELFGVG